MFSIHFSCVDARWLPGLQGSQGVILVVLSCYFFNHFAIPADYRGPGKDLVLAVGKKRGEGGFDKLHLAC